MAVIETALAAIAAGNFLLQLAGLPEVPKFVGTGLDAWQRIATLVAPSRENAKRAKAIRAALPQTEYPGAHPWDVAAADEAVARVVASVSRSDRLVAAVLDRNELHDFFAADAAVEEARLLSEPAQAVFRMVLAATEAYLLKTALEADGFAELAHLRELRDLAGLAEELQSLAERVERIPAETVRLLAGDDALFVQPVVKPTGLGIEPSRLLVPTSGAFPFIDRGDFLDQLTAWADDPAPFAAQVIGGLGGSGKTRLAVELCRRLSGRGDFWRAGFLRTTSLEPALAALRTQPGGRLVVMDYAETRTLDVARVLTQVQASATSLEPVRVLLLVRNPAMPATGQPNTDDPAQWVAAVRAPRQEAANQVLDETGCIVLGPVSLGDDDRKALFEAAVGALPPYLGLGAGAAPSPTETGFLARAEFAQPLYVAMAAYLYLSGHHQLDRGATQLFEGVLEHEAEYWQRTADLAAIQLGLTETEQRQVVAFATLTDATDLVEAKLLLATIDFLDGDASVLTRGRAHAWLQQLYPLPAGSHWGQLLPDRLGEYLVATELAGQSTMLDKVLDPARDPAQWLRPMQTLARASASYSALAEAVARLVDSRLTAWCERSRTIASGRDPWDSAAPVEALTSLVEAVGRRCSTRQLVSSSRILGLGNRLTAALCLVIDRAAVEVAGNSSPETRAGSLNNYAIRLAEVGQRDQALDPAREAVDAYRKLAEVNPAAYTPDLAGSLNNYAIRLAEVGQRDQALDPAREAVDAYRKLAEVNPAAYTPDLASSLNNYAIRLAEVGQRDQALDPAREAVDAYRKLAEVNPAAYTPALAMSLNTYANRLAEVGQRDQALDPAREAVDAYRKLAEVNPAAYTPALASSLNNYAISLARVGQRDEALAPAREAVDAYRKLAEVNPAAYTPDLAGSLNTYANRLAEVGQRDQALDPAREAVELRRKLAEVNPAAYTPALASSLNTYANRLAEVGQRDQALDPAREAVDAYRKLAEVNPAAYGDHFETSVGTLNAILALVESADAGQEQDR